MNRPHYPSGGRRIITTTTWYSRSLPRGMMTCSTARLLSVVTACLASVYGKNVDGRAACDPSDCGACAAAVRPPDTHNTASKTKYCVGQAVTMTLSWQGCILAVLCKATCTRLRAVQPKTKASRVLSVHVHALAVNWSLHFVRGLGFSQKCSKMVEPKT